MTISTTVTLWPGVRIEVKLALYSRQGVEEYRIVDPLAQTLDLYRQHDGILFHLAHLTRENTLYFFRE
jgi:Uma2 family endonuclease